MRGLIRFARRSGRAEEVHRLDTSDFGVDGAIAQAIAAVDARVGART
jgi:hypothetical protein